MHSFAVQEARYYGRCRCKVRCCVIYCVITMESKGSLSPTCSENSLPSLSVNLIHYCLWPSIHIKLCISYNNLATHTHNKKDRYTELILLPEHELVKMIEDHNLISLI